MSKRKRLGEPKGRQVLQALEMIQNLLKGLNSEGVQRLLESREVLSAIADGRLPVRQALASLGVPVRLPRGRVLLFDFFGVRDNTSTREVRDAFRRFGLAPATKDQCELFMAQHPDIVESLLIRSDCALVAAANVMVHPQKRDNDYYPAYYYASGEIRCLTAYIDTPWGRGDRFLGFRDLPAAMQAIPTVSIAQLNTKVRPQA